MNVFKDYSEYYDLLYKDKDYANEASYIDRLIRRSHPRASSILNLGCGTGTHDFLLAKHGYAVCGVDLSQDMINKANLKKVSLSSDPPVSFYCGDIRSIKLERTFDVVTSLFHVISYQVSNKDLRDVFSVISSHLNKGGLFVFDCWYGPAVLTDRPVVRIKRLESDTVDITRIAEPVIHENDNLVDVHYHVIIRDKRNGSVKELKETHQMRYLFKPELIDYMSAAGLTLRLCKEWLSDKEPGFNTWGVYFAGEKS
jgi:SAM-dependent methyltransferase